MLAAVQAIFALAFTLFGLVALFGIGITGLLFLIPGIVFAVTAGVVAEESRAAAALALAVDAVLAWFALRALTALSALESTRGTLHRFVEVLFPSAALLLVGVGVLALLMDWRSLRKASWF